MDLARKSKRKLLIIWERDYHVDCPFEYLFRVKDIDGLSVEVTDRFNASLYSTNDYLFYDYMGDDKNKPLRYLSDKHIYVRSAYRLVSKLWSVPDEDALTHALQPSGFVARLQRQALELAGSKFVGVHIRNLDPLEEIPDLPENEYKKDDMTLMKAYRASSNVTAFIGRVKELQADGFDSVYVATDSHKNIEALQDAVSARVYWLDHGGCGDRTCLCLQYALADLTTLAKADVLLGSYWSSFSEMAGMLAQKEVEYMGEVAT